MINAPDVPLHLRAPVSPPELAAETEADLARIVAGYDRALGDANGRISAIDRILTCFELRAANVDGPC